MEDASMKTVKAFVILIPTLLALSSYAKGQPHKFTPPKGKTLVAVGVSWGSNLSGYIKATGQVPQGCRFWCGFGSGGTNYFWHNARQAPKNGFLAITFTLDPAFPKNSTRSGPDKLRSFLDESRDQAIDEYGKAFKAFGRPIFVALGGEFDNDALSHGGFPDQYVRVFRRIHDRWDALGVTNVTYVWHTYTDNVASANPKANLTDSQLLEYYPGDKYVDLFGVSIYYQSQIPGAVRFARLAHQHNKPLAIMECGNGPYSRPPFSATWEDYYGPLFNVAQQLDARLLCYNNFGDEWATKRGPFADTQMDRMPADIQRSWAKMMTSPRFTIRENESEASANSKTKAGANRKNKQVDLRALLTTSDWRQQGGDGNPAPIRFLANGRINDPNGKATWSLKGSRLTVRWPNKNAPGGAWIDTCILSNDGRSYTGANQGGIGIRGFINGD
jgi:hypothetical protein